MPGAIAITSSAHSTTTSRTTGFSSNNSPATRLPPPRTRCLIAAGFNRLGPLRKNAGNQEVASSRNEVLTEMTNIVGAAFLGVTLGCARCHDHKFDPIRQSDYYRVQAYFAATHSNDIDKRYPRAAGSRGRRRWSPLQREMKQLRSSMRGKRGQERTAIEQKLEELQDHMPAPLPALFSVHDDRLRRRAIHLLARGDYQNKGDAVGMRPPGVLLPEGTPELPPDVKTPRAELAKWIVGSRQPAHRARHGESHLAVSFRPRHRGHAERFRPHGRAAHRIPSCSTGWPTNLWPRGWRVKRSTG